MQSLKINNKIINQRLTTIYINQFPDKNHFCPFFMTKEITTYQKPKKQYLKVEIKFN